MNSKEFFDIKGTNLIIEHNKTSVMLKTDSKNITRTYYLYLYFNEEFLSEIVRYIQDIAISIWKDFKPKEANSFSSDYYEYYDKKYENNGYISFRKNEIVIECPHEDSPYMYKFNKRKLESFTFDLINMCNKI